MTDQEPFRSDQPRSYFEIFEEHYLEPFCKLMILVLSLSLAFIFVQPEAVNWYGIPRGVSAGIGVIALLIWIKHLQSARD